MSKGKAIGSYFNLDITQRINFEFLKGIVSNKQRFTRLELLENKQCKDNNRAKVIKISINRSNETLLNILNKGN